MENYSPPPATLREFYPFPLFLRRQNEPDANAVPIANMREVRCDRYGDQEVTKNCAAVTECCLPTELCVITMACAQVNRCRWRLVTALLRWRPDQV